MANTGQMTTYTNTYNQRRTVTDRILLASPYDIAAIQALGLTNESKFKFVDTPGVVYTWFEDVKSPSSDILAASAASGANTITPATPSIYKKGDVLQIDDEYLWVSANNTTTISVSRGFGGTTAGSHSGGSASVYILYSARPEGADADETPYTDISQEYNYSTILQADIDISRSDSRIKRYGQSDILEYYIDKNMDMLMERLNRIPYYGLRASGTSGAPVRSSGGFKQFITTNVTDLEGAALTRRYIDDMLERIYSFGGAPDLILCGTWARRKINSFFEGFIDTVRDERVGGMRIDKLEHPLGGSLISIITDRHCQPDHIYFIDRRYAGFITIDKFFYEELAKTGDAERGQIVGEYGFVVQYQKAHGYIHGFAVSI
jgi:hypothetical protein